MNLEKEVFEYILKYKALNSLDIVGYFIDSGFTKQGVYKVLRKLKSENKILWAKQKVEIHLLWVQQEIDRLASAMPEKDLLFANISKKRVYYANNLVELEQLYGQLFISLIPLLSKDVKNYYFHDLHNYTYVNTTQIVDWYIDYILRHKGSIYLLVGSTSILDLELKSKAKMKQIHMYCTDTKPKHSLSIFGDYIITIKFDKKIYAEVDNIFQTMNEKQASIPLQNLYAKKSRHKITIEQNPPLARKYEKEFRKYFVIKD